MTRNNRQDSAQPPQHRAVALPLILLVAGMFGLAFASVPLYRLFCQATGYGGTPQRAEANAAALSARSIRIRFDATVAPGLPWSFRPVQGQMDVRIGETQLAAFTARNTSEQMIIGTATFNVTPEIAGPYFTKIQCFCFEEQVLRPGQSAEMPVSFFVDPAILDDPGARRLEEITLSYTFYNAGEGATATAPLTAKAGKGS